MLKDSPHPKPAATDPNLLFVLVHGWHSGAWVWEHVTPQSHFPMLQAPEELALKFNETISLIRG